MNPDGLRKQAQEAVLAHYGLLKAADLPGLSRYRRPIGATLGAIGGAAAGYYSAPEDASDTDKALRTAAGGAGGGLLGYGIAGLGQKVPTEVARDSVEEQLRYTTEALKKTQEAHKALKAARTPEERAKIIKDYLNEPGPHGFGLSPEEMHQALQDKNRVWEF